MKKSVIALAVATALPVAAAQADVTLSGSVSAEYTLGTNLVPVTETKLSAAASEVLANGMTATANFSVLDIPGYDVEEQGNIGLSGDFGEFKAGTAVKTLEDVAWGDDTELNGIDKYDADLNGIAYTGNIAGLSVNAAKGQYYYYDVDYDYDNGINTDYSKSDVVEYTTYGASYDLNGLTITGQNTRNNLVPLDPLDPLGPILPSATTKVTASYSFGDLTVSGSKSSTDANAVVKASYAATMDDLAVTVSADSENEWDLEAIYTMGNLVVTAEDDQDEGGAKISAKYTSGDLSLEVDSDNKVVVAYDMGNADLSMTRNDEDTKVKYVVAF